jgi:DNA mismatch endonuclease (patch repair protein)
MSGIRGRDTKPELAVRRAAHALGARFRLHRRDLPGTPDLIFPSRRKVILVHGCFWHQHPGCRLAAQPKSRPEYWLPKLARNVERDAQTLRRLEEARWDPLVIWECETKDRAKLESILLEFLPDLPRR